MTTFDDFIKNVEDGVTAKYKLQDFIQDIDRFCKSNVEKNGAFPGELPSTSQLEDLRKDLDNIPALVIHITKQAEKRSHKSWRTSVYYKHENRNKSEPFYEYLINQIVKYKNKSDIDAKTFLKCFIDSIKLIRNERNYR